MVGAAWAGKISLTAEVVPALLREQRNSAGAASDVPAAAAASWAMTGTRFPPADIIIIGGR